MLVKEILSINGEKYDVVEPEKYVKELIRQKKVMRKEEVLNGYRYEVREAGAMVEYFTIDSNGITVVERRGVLNERSIVLTRLTLGSGKIWYDKRGNQSQIVVPYELFLESYHKLSEHVKICMARERTRVLAKVDENVILRWNAYEEIVAAGGAIDVTELSRGRNEVFVISRSVLEEFYM